MSDIELISCPKCSVVLDAYSLRGTEREVRQETNYSKNDDGAICPVCKSFVSFRFDFIGSVSK